MATYKFPQFNVEIVNPQVVVNLVHDYIQVKECNVDVLLITNTTTFGVTFIGYTYTADWNDQDIINWVNNVELPKYEVLQ
jgi:hypothetical protein